VNGLLLGAADPDAARRVAEEILADRRFHPAHAPRPFAGFFRRAGELVVDPVLRLLRAIGGALPGVGSPLWLGLAVVVVAAAVFLTLRLSNRRSGSGFAGAGRRRPGDGGLDPEELEQRADGAERRGDLDAALRLRFQAGLLRLAGTGVLRLRPGLTNAAVRRTLRSPRFDELARHFDEVAYGGRPATATDVAAARAAWPLVVESARPPAGARP
jgi:hypothetical protein